MDTLFLDARMKLTDTQYNVIKLRYMEDKSVGLVSDIMGISYSGVRSAEARALRLLRQMITSYPYNSC